MFVNSAVKKSGTTITAIVTLTLCGIVLIYSKNCAEGAVNGITLCLNILIPSLFPFMALSSFIVKSGLSEFLGKPFAKPMKILFGLDGCFAPIILLSMIGGYPIGAKGISALYSCKSVSAKQAQRAGLMAVCAGPGFLINYVGVSLYGNEKTGALILIAQIISMLIIGIFLNIFRKAKNAKNSGSVKKSDNQKKIIVKNSPVPLSTAIVESALDSAKGMFNICVFVILFSAIIKVLENFTGDGLLNALIMSMLEVCCAVHILSVNYPLIFTAFAVGFGGICVHFQIYSAMSNVQLNKGKFFLTRVFQGFLTALLTYCGTKIFPNQISAFSTSTIQNVETGGGTIISGLVLVVVSICFLYTLRNYKT
ncbi:MAG: hypothetical protein MJ089_04900 [Ruminococcus sp.]|nr:hypothetical protein [Ruminococcus sp.]